MKIVPALKINHNIIVHNKNNNRVMCWDMDSKNWAVHDLVLGKLVCVDSSQEVAIDFLIGKR